MGSAGSIMWYVSAFTAASYTRPTESKYVSKVSKEGQWLERNEIPWGTVTGLLLTLDPSDFQTFQNSNFVQKRDLHKNDFCFELKDGGCKII